MPRQHGAGRHDPRPLPAQRGGRPAAGRRRHLGCSVRHLQPGRVSHRRQQRTDQPRSGCGADRPQNPDCPGSAAADRPVRGDSDRHGPSVHRFRDGCPARCGDRRDAPFGAAAAPGDPAGRAGRAAFGSGPALGLPHVLSTARAGQDRRRDRARRAGPVLPLRRRPADGVHRARQRRIGEHGGCIHPQPRCDRTGSDLIAQGPLRQPDCR